VNTLFGRRFQADGPTMGLSGFTTTATQTGAVLTLSADSVDFNFDRFAVCAVTGPGMGSLRVDLGSNPQRIVLDAPEKGANCFETTSPEPVSEVTLTTEDDRPVSLTSWRTLRGSGGFSLNNMGVVGSTLSNMSRMDDKVMMTELQLIDPDLVVVAFGTNEGFDPGFKAATFTAHLREQIGRVRTLLGREVPILLVGPPDVATRRNEIARPTHPDTAHCRGDWMVPASITEVRAVELELSGELGLAFWDWQAAMGGACTSSTWGARGLQREDHVHFTAAGGDIIAGRLVNALDMARLAMFPR